MKNTTSPTINGNKMHYRYILMMELSKSIKQMKYYILIIKSVPMLI